MGRTKMGGMIVQSQTQSRSTTTPGRGYTMAAFALAVVALVLLPPVLGIAAAAFGGVGYSKGDKLGMWAAVTAIVCGVIGMAIGAAVLMNR